MWESHNTEKKQCAKNNNKKIKKCNAVHIKDLKWCCVPFVVTHPKLQQVMLAPILQEQVQARPTLQQTTGSTLVTSTVNWVQKYSSLHLMATSFKSIFEDFTHGAYLPFMASSDWFRYLGCWTAVKRLLLFNPASSVKHRWVYRPLTGNRPRVHSSKGMSDGDVGWCH
jgi:hypothetical protein